MRLRLCVFVAPCVCDFFSFAIFIVFFFVHFVCSFSMFCEMFRHLPVCSVIHDKVLVIHGGLFHREGVMLQDIEEV